jgi:hypothetical protein
VVGLCAFIRVSILLIVEKQPAYGNSRLGASPPVRALPDPEATGLLAGAGAGAGTGAATDLFPVACFLGGGVGESLSRSLELGSTGAGRLRGFVLVLVLPLLPTLVRALVPAALVLAAVLPDARGRLRWAV